MLIEVVPNVRETELPRPPQLVAQRRSEGSRNPQFKWRLAQIIVHVDENDRIAVMVLARAHANAATAIRGNGLSDGSINSTMA